MGSHKKTGNRARNHKLLGGREDVARRSLMFPLPAARIVFLKTQEQGAMYQKIPMWEGVVSTNAA